VRCSGELVYSRLGDACSKKTGGKSVWSWSVMQHLLATQHMVPKAPRQAHHLTIHIV
jgi:hypothetical protein